MQKLRRTSITVNLTIPFGILASRDLYIPYTLITEIILKLNNIRVHKGSHCSLPMFRLRGNQLNSESQNRISHKATFIKCCMDVPIVIIMTCLTQYN